MNTIYIWMHSVSTSTRVTLKYVILLFLAFIIFSQYMNSPPTVESSEKSVFFVNLFFYKKKIQLNFYGGPAHDMQEKKNEIVRTIY